MGAVMVPSSLSTRSASPDCILNLPITEHLHSILMPTILNLELQSFKIIILTNLEKNSFKESVTILSENNDNLS